MKHILLIVAAFCGSLALADTPDITIPAPDIALIKTADHVEVSGTNDSGGAEDFTIHDWKAIRQFVQLLTSDRFTAAPKNLKPDFKSKSAYKVRLSSKGAVVLEFTVIADSILDIPNDPSYYMQSDRHSDNLLAPLLRLR